MPVSNHSIIPAILWSIILFFAAVFICLYPAGADEPEEFRAAIVVSRHIKPYMDALKGMRESMTDSVRVDQKVYILEPHDLEYPARLTNELSSQDFDILVSIGPEATSLVWSVSAHTGLPAVHSMILNPEVLAADDHQPGCGVSLGIPVANQLQDIRDALPGVKRLGVLFDPDINQSFILQAMEDSHSSGLEIIPLNVSSSKEVPAALNANWARIHALWLIPDQTVISQTLVEYIVKEALFQKKPVIGYNRFFYDSGAAVAFTFNFEQIGRQTAAVAVNQLKGLYCEKMVPSYDVLINHRVLQSLGLEALEVSP
jgi:putative tryptophan/tyrosine transport system substrate-binding protein